MTFASVLGVVPTIIRRSYDMPSSVGGIIDTGIPNRGIIVCSITGTLTLSIYAGNSENNALIAVTEGYGIKSATDGTFYTISVTESTLKFKRNITDNDYNYKLNITRIL